MEDSMGIPYEERHRAEAERQRPQPVLVIQTMADLAVFVHLIRNEELDLAKVNELAATLDKSAARLKAATPSQQAP